MNALCQHCEQPFVKKVARARYCSYRCSGAATAAARRAAGEPERRFLANIQRGPAEDCWPWKASTSLGYGRLRFKGRKIGAHVLAYRLAKGDIPAGLMVLHRCGNRLCCNPGHLYAGTHANNTNDAVRHGTHKCGFGRGSEHICARLKASDIPQIRAALGRGESQRAIGERFGVTQQTIWHVAHGNTWRHVA